MKAIERRDHEGPSASKKGGVSRVAPRWARPMMVIALLVAVVGALTTATSGQAHAFPRAEFGFSEGGYSLKRSNAQLAATYDSASELGATWSRMVAYWPDIEPSPGKFDWSNTDRLVNGAKARGFRVDIILLGAPTWAGGNGLPGTPPNAAAFGNFAAAAARHLGNRVDAYEIWNEPNLVNMFTPVDPARYASLLRAAYPRIKAIDPSSTVLSGGLASTTALNLGAYTTPPVEFLRQMYAAGARGFVDAVADHPYTFPFTADRDPNARWAQTAQMYDIMRANGDGGKKIWITEFGAPTGTGNGAVSDAAQGAILTSALREGASRPYIGPMFLHCIQDPGSNPSNVEDNFGVTRINNSKKPAFWAVKSQIR